MGSVQCRHPIGKEAATVLTPSQRYQVTHQLLHMSHTLYYPISTALQYDVLLSNDIVLRAQWLIKGYEGKRPYIYLESPRDPSQIAIFILCIKATIVTCRVTGFIIQQAPPVHCNNTIVCGMWCYCLIFSFLVHKFMCLYVNIR